MTADDNRDADAAQAADSTAPRAAASHESTRLGVEGTVREVENQLKPQSPVDNLKSNVPVAGDSLFTKVMKVITSWT